MNTSIHIDTNDSKRPAFAAQPAFFCVEYPTDMLTRQRMLGLQEVVHRINNATARLAEYRVPNTDAQETMEVLWQEVERIVLRFAGESAETKQSAKGTEAPTSAPSGDSSVPQESRSSTKRKATQST